MNNFTSITSRQFVMGWITKTIAIVIMLTIADTIKYSGRDTWLAVLVGAVIAVFSLLIIYRLVSQFPNKNLAQWSREAFGSFLGSVITIIYIILFFSYAVLATNQYSQIMTGVFVPEDPRISYHVILIVPAVYAAVLGVYVIYRLNEILLPIAALISVAVIGLNYASIDFTNFLPVMEQGVKPVINGGLIIGSRFSFVAIMFVLYPLIIHPKKIITQGFMGLFALVILIQLQVLAIAMFGAQYTSTMQFSFLEIARNIGVSDALSRLDSFILTMWITGIFVFVSIFLYGASVLTMDLLKLKNYSYFTVFFGFAVVVINLFLKDNVSLIKHFMGLPLAYAVLSVSLLLPLLMLMFVSVKKGISS
ncbi:MAG: hypothetical protein FH758_08785 [Firmicutes bacterium]|nr:hypothetical protein [Bacillota bacterium]